MSTPLEKVWGVDHTLHSSAVAELHILDMKNGGYTSHHSHTVRTSYLQVLEGVLKVSQDCDGYGSSTRILNAGHHVTIPPGNIHQLEAMTDCKVIELYAPNFMDDDIVRFDEGGMKK